MITSSDSNLFSFAIRLKDSRKRKRYLANLKSIAKLTAGNIYEKVNKVKPVSKVSLIAVLLFSLICTPVLAETNYSQFDLNSDFKTYRSLIGSDNAIINITTEPILIAKATKQRQGIFQRVKFWERKPKTEKKGKRQGLFQRFNRKNKQKPPKIKQRKRQGFWQRMNVRKYFPKFKQRRNQRRDRKGQNIFGSRIG